MERMEEWWNRGEEVSGTSGGIEERNKDEGEERRVEGDAEGKVG